MKKWSVADGEEQDGINGLSPFLGRVAVRRSGQWTERKNTRRTLASAESGNLKKKQNKKNDKERKEDESCPVTFPPTHRPSAWLPNAFVLKGKTTDTKFNASIRDVAGVNTTLVICSSKFVSLPLAR